MYVLKWRNVFLLVNGQDKKILDVGCGFGLISIIFCLSGAQEVIGCDHNPEKIEIFNKLLKEFNPSLQGIQAQLADGLTLPYADNSFDVVIANDVISHVRDLGLFLQEVKRVLKDSGLFFLEDGNNSLYLPSKIAHRRHRNEWEYGPVDPSEVRGTDLAVPYIELRKQIIRKQFPSLDERTIQHLSKKTAGMYGAQVVEAAERLLTKKKIVKPIFKYRHPITGEFQEREFNPIRLRRELMQRGFDVEFLKPLFSPFYRGLKGLLKRLFLLIFAFYPAFSFFVLPYFRFICIKKHAQTTR